MVLECPPPGSSILVAIKISNLIVYAFSTKGKYMYEIEVGYSDRSYIFAIWVIHRPETFADWVRQFRQGHLK